MLLNIPLNLLASDAAPGLTSVEIQVPAGAVRSNLTGFPLKIDLSRMPEDFWTNVRSDGGNLRAYQSDGVTMIPHDLTFIDKATHRGRFYIKTNLNSGSDNSVIIGILGSGVTKLAATDPNGRNAVWSSYAAVVVFPETINRVNGNVGVINPTLPNSATWRETRVLTLNSTNQGAAFDGTTYFTASTATIRRYDINGTELQNVSPLAAFRTATGDATLDHIGAPALIDDEVWVPIQQYPASPYNSQYIGRYAKSNLAYIGFIQLTGATRESSGVHYDAELDRLYVTDYTINGNIPYFNKTTGAYVNQLTLSSDIDNMQGMTELNGKYYVNSGGNGVYEVEKNGTVNGIVLVSPYSGDDESVYAYNGTLITCQDSARVITWEKHHPRGDWGRLHNTPIAFTLTKSDVWTMGVSWEPFPDRPQQTLLRLDAEAALGTDFAYGAYDDPIGFGIWNTTNGWLYPQEGNRLPRNHERYRVAFAQNGSSARKMRAGSFKNSAATSSPRPLDAGNMRWGIGGSSEPGYGYYQHAWLRYEYMSDDWLEADWANEVLEDTFYRILPDEEAAFPETYTFRSTVNFNNGGRQSDWVQEIALANMGSLGGSDRWIMAEDADRSIVYQRKRIRSSQYSAVDAGNALVTFSSDLVTFTGDTDWIATYAEFYDVSGNFLGRVNSSFISTDAGTGAPNIVTSADRRVPPGTRTIHFGWQAGRNTGSELSAYPRDFDASIDDDSTYVSGTVVWAELDANSSGWVTTTGAPTFNVRTTTPLGPPGAGSRGYYSGGSVVRSTTYKDFSFPSGWAAKVAAGKAVIRFRANVFNSNDDDDVGIKITYNGSASGTLDTGRIVTRAVPQSVELTGAVPTDATSIRVTLDFWREDGTVNDGCMSLPSMLLFEIP